LALLDFQAWLRPNIAVQVAGAITQAAIIPKTAAGVITGADVMEKAIKAGACMG